MAISFFAEKNFLGSIIRGKQIADWMGWKYNPKEGFENDLRIYIKPRTLDKVRDSDWVDVSDGEWLVEHLKARPKINIITHSLKTYEILKEELPNKIVWISQQHLNWERDKRNRNEMNTCGYIGHPNELAFKICNRMDEKIKSIGWNFVSCFDYKTREDAAAFYKKIDLLVIPDLSPWKDPPYKTPTKLINAASFGVPSVAYPTEGYQEFEGYYVRAKDLDEMAIEVQKFKDENYYNEWSEKIIKKAEEYHISNVAKRYCNLL
jgi:glycosyltransferase involved in cell wall biosynthesis